MRILRFVDVRCDTNCIAVCILPNSSLTPMLEFCKTVLTRVSFDRRLFARELNKCFRWLSKDDARALKTWALTQYQHKYGHLITTAFAAAHAM